MKFFKMKLRLQTVVLVALCVYIVMKVNTSNFMQFSQHKENGERNFQHKNQKHKQPHILFVLADDLGFNDIGYHGSNIKTPNLDKLAMSGVRLENYYTQAVCTPTRGALLTGRYPIHTGVQRAYLPGQPIGMPLDITTITEKLREAGYSTHMVGKWHLGFHTRKFLPTNRGFDSFFGFYNGFSDHFTHIAKHRHGIKGYDLVENDHPVNWTLYKGYYSTDLFADKTIDIIRKHGSDKPLFVYLPFQAVHSPVQAPQKYVQQKGKTSSKTRDTYEGMVMCMDEAVGRVVEAMKGRGFWENTIFVFSTDNGGPNKTGASNWPLKGFKGTGWEGGVRAVGFVHSNLLSDTVKGTVSKELMHVTDWFPTFLNLAGGNVSGNTPLDGHDQWKSISSGIPSQREEILHDILPGDSPGEPLPNETLSITSLRRASIRIGEWKIIKDILSKHSATDQLKDTARTSLFNIEQDPSEVEDLSKQYPNMVRNMLKRIEYYHQRMVPSPNPKEERLADPRYRKGFWEPWYEGNMS